ncbi:acylneuraminate cytidylyltransferase family protein [Vibrio breoganii]
MIDGKNVVALIPARGGSKRLPRKNILDLAGKPLITWTIEAALNCQYIDEVIVSTDDQEIRDVAIKSGASVPELRPDSLSSDTAKTEDVILYTLDRFINKPEILILLQPTSPLRTSNQMTESLAFYVEKKADAVVSVTPSEHSPLWSNTLPDDLSMDGFIDTSALKRSQDLYQFYRLNGAIYIFDVNKLTRERKIEYKSGYYAYVMDNMSSVDIDNDIDFLMAESIINARKK